MIEGYIFKITNTITGKAYIRRSLLNFVLQSHLTNAMPSAAIAKDVKKYGWQAFKVEKLGVIRCASRQATIDTLREVKKEYVVRHNTLHPNGYNLVAKASKTLYSEATIAKHSASKLGKKRPNQAGKNHWNYGRRSQPSINKIINIVENEFKGIGLLYYGGRHRGYYYYGKPRPGNYRDKIDKELYTTNRDHINRFMRKSIARHIKKPIGLMSYRSGLIEYLKANNRQSTQTEIIKLGKEIQPNRPLHGYCRFNRHGTLKEVVHIPANA